MPLAEFQHIQMITNAGEYSFAKREKKLIIITIRELNRIASGVKLPKKSSIQQKQCNNCRLFVMEIFRCIFEIK